MLTGKWSIEAFILPDMVINGGSGEPLYYIADVYSISGWISFTIGTYSVIRKGKTKGYRLTLIYLSKALMNRKG